MRPRPPSRYSRAARRPARSQRQDASPQDSEARVRALSIKLWSRIRLDWAFAATELSRELKEARTLRSHERREVAEVLYGMIREARRIDFALETAGVRLRADEHRELTRYLTYRIFAGELSPEAAGEIHPEVDWAAVASVDEQIARERDPVKRLALSRSLPDWLAKTLLDEYGDEADALMRAMNARGPLTLRTNIERTTREALLESLEKAGLHPVATTHSRWGVSLAERADVWSLEAFKAGWFEVQDEASQLIAELVAPPPKAVVIDACAGAGGKTLALGAMMHSRGRLIAIDVDEHKLKELRRRARRAGLSSVQALITPEDAWTGEVSELIGRCDRVLIDAPCTGTGSLRRNPEIRWRLQPEDADRMAIEQESLVRRAVPLLATGGRVIYATCSVLRSENEAVVERVLSREPSLEVVRVTEIWGHARADALTDPSGTFFKTLPNRQGTDGFFAAVLRKR